MCNPDDQEHLDINEQILDDDHTVIASSPHVTSKQAELSFFRIFSCSTLNSSGSEENEREFIRKARLLLIFAYRVPRFPEFLLWG